MFNVAGVFYFIIILFLKLLTRFLNLLQLRYNASVLVHYGLKLGANRKSFFQRNSFYFIINMWTWACGVYSNMLALAPSEAGASPAGSTPQSLLIFQRAFWFYPLISNKVPRRPGTAPLTANKFFSKSIFTIFKFLIVILSFPARPGIFLPLVVL